MIVLEKVTKKYHNRTVLDEVSFNIQSGEFVSIVGSSGAGKTTIIHALIGATNVNSGRISVDGHEISGMSSSEIQEYRRKVGIVFQDYKLLPQKTVFENVAFALEVAGYDSSFVNARTTDALKLVGMETQRNHFPHQLSGGERQRTAIARALVHAPELLFADEPTGNLDPENTMSLAKLLKKINEAGTTVVISTHDKEVVNFLQKRVITLDNGKVVGDKREATYN